MEAFKKAMNIAGYANESMAFYGNKMCEDLVLSWLLSVFVF